MISNLLLVGQKEREATKNERSHYGAVDES